MPRTPVDLESGAHGMPAAHVVEVGCQQDGREAPLSGHLSAAGRDGVEDLDGGGFERRFLIVVRPGHAEPVVDEEPAAEWPRFLQPQRADAVRRRVGALRLIERADAEIVCRVVIGAERQADRLIPGDRVVDESLDRHVVSQAS